MECIYDDSYPDIWNTPSEREGHLFETEYDCCDTWNCHTEIATPSDDGRWLSNEAGTDCVFMTLPQNMLDDVDWLFETRDDCCAVGNCPENAVPVTSAPSSQPTANPTRRPSSRPATQSPSSRPTAEPVTPAASSPEDVPDRWYPMAFVESGAMGCEYGKAYADTLGLVERNYDSNDECCAAWPELCYITTSTTRTSYFKVRQF